MASSKFLMIVMSLCLTVVASTTQAADKDREQPSDLGWPQATAWFDISVDEAGRVTEATAASDINQVLVKPLHDWVMRQSFEPAMVGNQAVPSTTAIWVTYTLENKNDGYELQVLRYDEGVRPIRLVSPEYPRQAALDGLEGWARVRVTIRPSGAVRDVRVVASSHLVFERPAVHAVRQWRFKPKTVDGKPIPNSPEFEQTIDFKLRD